MSDYRSLNQFVLGKIETTSGVDSSPVPGADAVLVENPDFSPPLNTQDTNEVTGSLDARAPISTTGSRGMTAKTYLSGSGTAGTQPRWFPLLQAASYGITTLAADVTGTAAAGAAGSITLASPASTTADFYLGFVIEITGGTGSGQRRICTGYTTGRVASVSPNWTVTPDTTSVYAVRKGNRASLQSATLPTATLYRYQLRQDGASAKLAKIIGAAGNSKLSLGSSGCFFDHDFKGSLVPNADVSVPTAPTYDTTRPPPFINAQVYFGNIKARLNNFTFDPGCEVTLEEDPNQAYGFATAGITRRKPGGSFRLPKDLESTRDVLDSWANGTEYQLTAIWGQSAGNRFAVLSQHMVFTGGKDTDVSGFAYDDIPFRTNGQDTGLFVTAW